MTTPSIRKVYTFNTLVPADLGAVVTRATLVSICDAAAARRYEDIDSKHARLLPALPNGTPRDVNLLTFYVFKGQNGSTAVYASAWIDENSLEEVVSIGIRVDIVQASLSDVERVRIALSALGNITFTISEI